MAAKKPKKKQSIRNNEYYDTQECFDKLYQGSQQGKRFTKLMELITSEENIMLAYRSIKKNKGSMTKGVNNSTIIQIGEKAPESGDTKTGWAVTSAGDTHNRGPYDSAVHQTGAGANL